MASLARRGVLYGWRFGCIERTWLVLRPAADCSSPPARACRYLAVSHCGMCLAFPLSHLRKHTLVVGCVTKWPAPVCVCMVLLYQCVHGKACAAPCWRAHTPMLAPLMRRLVYIPPGRDDCGHAGGNSGHRTRYPRSAATACVHVSATQTALQGTAFTHGFHEHLERTEGGTPGAVVRRVVHSAAMSP